MLVALHLSIIVALPYLRILIVSCATICTSFDDDITEWAVLPADAVIFASPRFDAESRGA
jgi:hypothetical protein